jgi:hypothetical protein
VDCKIDDCTNPVVAKEMCSKHYTRWRRHGDPLVVKPPQERPPCGTYLGYLAHHRRSETACAPCKQANSEYHKQRRTDPAVRERDWRRNAVYSKALWRLAREYPKRFTELVEQFKAEVGT